MEENKDKSENDILYSVPISEKRPGETSIYRNPDAVKEFTTTANNN